MFNGYLETQLTQGLPFRSVLEEETLSGECHLTPSLKRTTNRDYY